jgi:hypothetical protein
VLDEATLKRVHQISREAGMQHMKVKASVEALADQGVFEGLAAVYTVDRDGDQIRPGVFEKTVARWQASGKRQPLHWNHQGEAENVIGCVNPGMWSRPTMDSMSRASSTCKTARSPGRPGGR